MLGEPRDMLTGLHVGGWGGRELAGGQVEGLAGAQAQRSPNGELS